jgi:hypothetical protein
MIFRRQAEDGRGARTPTGDTALMGHGIDRATRWLYPGLVGAPTWLGASGRAPFMSEVNHGVRP